MSRRRTQLLLVKNALEVENILNIQRDELVLQDLLRSEGRREMLGVIKRQLADLDERLGKLDIEISPCKGAAKKI